MKTLPGKTIFAQLKRKLAKDIGLLYRAKYLLDESSVKTLYFTHI